MAIAHKPFTAIVEEVMLEVRENSTEAAVERKYQRRVNDIYARELSQKDFDFLKTSNSITVGAAYSTGTISGSSGSTSVTGSGTTWTNTHTGYKLKISGNDEIYTFTYASGTTGTVTPALTADISADSYIMFQDTYSLASDFDRFAIPPGMFYDYGGSRVSISPQFPKDWYQTWTTNSTNLPTHYRLFGRSSSTLYWQVQVTPPITAAKKLSYEYYPLLTEMTEYITGTCATTAGDATITGTSTDFVNNVSAGDAFRMDSAPNDWYIVSSVTDATHLELSAAYPVTKTTAAYTICKIPQMPVSLHLAIFYGACSLSSQDQDNATAAKTYQALYQKTITDYMANQSKGKLGRQVMRVKEKYR